LLKRNEQAGLMDILLLLLIGTTTGFLTGFLGIGGGTIVVPAMTFLLSMTIKEAIGTSTLKIFLSVLFSNAWLFYQNKEYYNFPLKPVFLLSAGAVLGSPLGAMGTHLVPDAVLYVVFAGLLIFFSFQLFFQKQKQMPADPDKKRERGWLAYAILGFGAGFASGLLGVGGAFIMVPVMYTYFSVNMYRATSISFLVLIFISFFGSITHFINEYVDIIAAFVLTLGAIPFTVIGSHLRAKAPQWILRYCFALLLFLVAIRMFWEVLWL